MQNEHSNQLTYSKKLPYTVACMVRVVESTQKMLKRVLSQWYHKTYCRQNFDSMLIKRMCIADRALNIF